MKKGIKILALVAMTAVTVEAVRRVRKHCSKGKLDQSKIKTIKTSDIHFPKCSMLS